MVSGLTMSPLCGSPPMESTGGCCVNSRRHTSLLGRQGCSTYRKYASHPWLHRYLVWLATCHSTRLTHYQREGGFDLARSGSVCSRSWLRKASSVSTICSPVAPASDEGVRRRRPGPS